jgi:PAS domain S-box-containing protein
MAKLPPPFLTRLALVSSSTGWAAALYGALYIYAAADFATTRSLWIFGWPFVALLSIATGVHVVLAGGAASFGLASPFTAVTIANRVIAAGDGREDIHHQELATALAWLPWAPVAHTLWCTLLAALVVVAMAVLERHVAGSTLNVGAVVTGGAIATVVYGAMTFTVCELLVSRPCHQLRLTALRRGLDPYRGPTVHTWVRVITLAIPGVLAVAVALRLSVTPELAYGWLAQAALMMVSAGICAALAWLQALAIRRAAADLGVAATRLARGESVGLITGAIDAHLVGLASAFNAAADEIERSRQVSAARYAALFEGAGDAILLLDATGHILEANRRAQELTVLDEQALKATRFVDLFVDGGPARAASVAPGHWAAGARVARSDGSECPVDVALSAVQLGDHTVVQAILHDMSHRERIEHELRRAVRRLEGLYQLAVTLGGSVEQVADHVVATLAELLDAPLVAVASIVGDALVVHALYDDGTLVHGRRVPLAGTASDRVRAAAAPCVFDLAARRFPSDVLVVERGIETYVGVPVVGRSNDVVGVVCVLDTRVRTLREEDLQLLSSYAERLARALDEEEYVRERESFLRQLTTQNVELSVAKERLTSADRLKSEFMGMMSHELRTPLNIFIGYTDLLLDASDDPRASLAGNRELLDRMRDLAHTLTTLVEDTLSVLRLESAGVAVNLESVAVGALFGELQATERFVHGPTGVVERWEVEEDLPPIVSDRLKLRQILTNLVGNARKFTPRGTITVGAASAGPERLALTVEDTGCGIAAADLPHIFELYRQAANGGVHNGCGIGLYIVRRYCELLGGHVEVVSEVGRGTRFTVTLPHEPTAGGSVAAGSPTAAVASRPAT